MSIGTQRSKKIVITRFTPSEESAWEQLVQDSPLGMLYHSIKWLRILADFTGVIPLHLVAKDHDRLVGILPVFLKKGKWGNVLNSSPFYGSHGGVLVHSEEYKAEIQQQLLAGFTELAHGYGCITSTVISSPFDTGPDAYKYGLNPQKIDQRIGQIVHFPLSHGTPEEALMQSFESRGRNSVRKAIKSGVSVSSSTTPEHVRDLYQLHVSNMNDLGGLAKPLTFFEHLTRVLEPGTEWKLWRAECEGQTIAMMLLLYYKDMIEYYTPVVQREYRSQQPLSLLLFHAMAEGMKRGYRFWNFGGTWLSQKGVYRFKKQWNAEDHPYYYYVNTYDDIEPLTRLTKEELLQEYQWFYVFPYYANKL